MSSNPLFYHESVPLGLRVAQTVGLTAAGMLAGANIGITFFAIPGAMDSPAPLLAKQWKKCFDLGVRSIVPAQILCGALFGYLAYLERNAQPTFSLYTTAAVMMIAPVPYTAILINPTNAKLFKKNENFASTELTDTAAEASGSGEETTHSLVEQWNTLNLGRILMQTIGAGCAIWAAVDRLQVVGFQNVGLSGGANRMGN